MRLDVKVIKNHINIKGSQVMTAFEFIGRIFGGGKGIGAVVSLTAVSVPIAGAVVHDELKKSEQKEKDSLYQKAILKQNAEIRGLKKQADICNERQEHYQKVIDTVLFNGKESVPNEQV
ncbi:hypothetical protein LAD12857_15460 [Lacrimispora amygdalina]|uniref:Uncharacterized protein n=1 Tax=Lacrimispora amygdalina TaxID=253257 RepID=A0ABQ5M3T9_9FIRM